MAFSRFFDPQFQSYSINVMPGDFYVTANPTEMLVTILGSCVSACIRNPQTGLGGLNHFMLAEPSESVTSVSSRYGSYAMEQLINEILKSGGSRSTLEIKIFGGADLLKNRHQIGSQNIKFIKNYLQKEGLNITAEDLGGEKPRKIYYWPSTGRVLRHLISPTDKSKLIEEEEKYKEKIKVKKIGQPIELF